MDEDFYFLLAERIMSNGTSNRKLEGLVQFKTGKGFVDLGISLGKDNPHMARGYEEGIAEYVRRLREIVVIDESQSPAEFNRRLDEAYSDK